MHFKIVAIILVLEYLLIDTYFSKLEEIVQEFTLANFRIFD